MVNATFKIVTVLRANTTDNFSVVYGVIVIADLTTAFCSFDL